MKDDDKKNMYRPSRMTKYQNGDTTGRHKLLLEITRLCLVTYIDFRLLTVPSFTKWSLFNYWACNLTGIYCFRFGMVSLFNGISTLFRLFNAKAILLEEQ